MDVKNFNLYNPKQKSVITQRSAKLSGFGGTIEEFKKNGLFPIFYDIPENINRDFYTFVPKGELNNINDCDKIDGGYIQRFDTIELSIDECKNNLINHIEQNASEMIDEKNILKTSFGFNVKVCKTTLMQLTNILQAPIKDENAVTIIDCDGNEHVLSKKKVQDVFIEVENAMTSLETQKNEKIEAVKKAQDIETLKKIDLNFTF